MTTFTNNDVSSGDIVRASDHNTQGSLLAAVLNGGIENANVSDTAAIAGSKLADASIANGKITDHTIQPIKLTAVDGYIVAEDTWTYVSASSFKISGVDRTALFPAGTKLKLTQTTTKYFYVTSSTFSTDTTVNVTGGTDYTLANAAITSPYYSYGATPQGFPASFAYTPTLVNLSGGTITKAIFTMNGKWVDVLFIYTLAGAGVAGSVTLTTPITASSDYSVTEAYVGQCQFRDTGTAISAGRARLETTTTLILLVDVTSGTYAAPTTLTNLIPHTWANTDIISVTARYKAA